MNTGRTGHRGFTLLELVVVMVLLAIIVATAGINLLQRPSSVVSKEAERMALLLQTLQDQAILEGRIFAVRFDTDRYTFYHLSDKGSLELIQDDGMFRQRRFPEDVRAIEVQINGRPAPEEGPGIVVTPTGDLPIFSIVLEKDDYRWQVGTTDGGIRFNPVDA